MINAVTTGIIGLYNDLYGQFILNIFITLPLLIYGFIAWKKNMALNKSKDIIIRKFNLKQLIIALICSIIIWIVYGLFLTFLPQIAYNIFNIHISKDPQIILDSFTCVMTIMATYLTGKRFIEQWIFWIVFNSISIIMFIIQSIGVSITNPSMLVADFSDILSLLQYIIGVTYGYILWRKMMKKEHELVITLEDDILEGGFGEKIASFYGTTNMKVKNYGIRKSFPDRYIVDELLKENGITVEQIIADIKEIIDIK